jgi:uncharacterized surface protein with fasciclin (FAS1) repeats
MNLLLPQTRSLNIMNILYKKITIATIVGITTAILTSLPSAAQPPSVNTENFKQNKPAQRRRNVLNTRPSILDECPYNRAACGTTPTPTPITPIPTQPPTPPRTTETPTQDLVTLTEKNPSFKTLTKALKAAGLTQTLKGSGPFTVFAPSDKAFAELPKDALQDLLKPENKEVIVKIMTYHVVPGQVLSTDLKTGEVKSSEGGLISVRITGQDVMVNDAKVVQPDIKATNGVIHVIDKVILPPDL